MIAAALACLAVGVTAMLAWIVMALSGVQAMPSYLGSWLFWIAIPIGALPLVMGLEAVGDPVPALTRALRLALPLLPAGLVLAVPFLIGNHALFFRPGIDKPLPQAWMNPPLFILRTVVLVAVLSAIAIAFSVPPRSRNRRTAAVLGLCAFACILTVLAADWLLAIQPGIASSALGLLLIASQLGVASAIAAFVVAVSGKGRLQQPHIGGLLAAVIAAWLFMHFTQFLVIWSANLPDEVTWYIDRASPLGAATIWFGFIAAVIALAVLPTALGQLRPVLASIAAMLVLVHVLEALWFVTPAFRGRFVIDWADACAVFGIGGLVLALLLLRLHRDGRRAHAAG